LSYKNENYLSEVYNNNIYVIVLKLNFLLGVLISLHGTLQSAEDHLGNTAVNPAI
jgi:hypothetical protein